MRKTQKFLALVLALVLVFGLSIGVFAEGEGFELQAEFKTELAEDYTGKTVIVHSNDVHGSLEGYAYIAQLKADFAAKGAEVILVDAGDFSQGNPYVSVYKGASAVELMNAAGYDVATLGNHEFDFGYEQLMENVENANFKVVCADVLKDGEPILDANTIIEKGGVKIGFFGLETPETLTKVNPGLIKGLTFLSNTDGKTELYDCAAAQAKALKEAGADIIIGLWHLGVAEESKTDGHRSMDVFAKVEGVDFVIDGHSNSVMTVCENGEPIQSTGKYLPNIGVIVIDNATKKIEDNYLIPVKTTDEEGNVTSELAKDEAVLAKAQEIIDAVDAQYGEVFAVSEVELEGNAAPGNRTTQTNNGNLITEALLWTVLKEGELDVPAENVVAITNGGGIRAAIAVGDVTMKDINTVLPFGNTVAVIYVTGAELLEALEASTFCTPTKIGGYPQTTGITWTLNTTKAYNANAETYPDSTYYGPATIERVTVKAINGQAFDPEATYAVVTNNFCAAGGDTYYIFKNASAQFDTGIPMDEAVMDYVKTELNGVIGAKYATDRGDLKVITAENSSCQQSSQTITLNGEAVEVESYLINDENYLKLRDFAALLNGTSAQFEISFDDETQEISIESGKAYTLVGGELEKGEDRSESLVSSAQTIKLDGTEKALTAFNLEGNNYLRLRDLCRVFGVEVEWVEETRTAALTTAPLSEEAPAEETAAEVTEPEAVE